MSKNFEQQNVADQFATSLSGDSNSSSAPNSNESWQSNFAKETLSPKFIQAIPNKALPEKVFDKVPGLPPVYNFEPMAPEAEELPGPIKKQTSAQEEIAGLFETSLMLTSGYLSADRGSKKIAALASEKLFTLSDYAITEDLALDFLQSRHDITKELKSRFEISSKQISEMVTAEPDLFKPGYRFEFGKSSIADEMKNKLYRGGNIGEVLDALDNIPQQNLNFGQIQEVANYAEHLGKSPLIKEEGLIHLTEQVVNGSAKLEKVYTEILSNSGSDLARSVAESDLQVAVKNLRMNLGSKKFEADEYIRRLGIDQPELLEYGPRFEFDESISPERIAELKRPSQLNELIEAIERTNAPNSKVLITSQGEHLENLKGLSESAIVKSEGLTDMAARLEKNAAKVITARTKAFELLGQEPSRFMMKSLGILGAGLATNWLVDKALFNNQKPGFNSYTVDVAAPMILFSDFSPKIKFGAIVGAHILARLSEKPAAETKKKYQAE